MKVRIATALAASLLFTLSATAAQAQQGRMPTTRDLLGRWGSAGDCRNWTEYRAGARWRDRQGGGEWHLEDGVLTNSIDGVAGGAPPAVTLRLLPDGSLRATYEDSGTSERWVRCPAPAPRPRRR